MKFAAFITIYHKYVGHISDILLDMGNFDGYGVLTRRWLLKTSTFLAHPENLCF